MYEPKMDKLVQRLDRLERENRWLKRIVALVVVVIAAVVLMGQAKSTKVAKVIEAEKIVLIDKDTGAVSATLEKKGNAAGLFLYGLTGKTIAEMSVSFGVGPVVNLYGTEGKVRASLTATFYGNLDLYDGEGNHRILLGKNYSFYPEETNLKKMVREVMGLGLFDKKGKTLWKAP